MKYFGIPRGARLMSKQEEAERRRQLALKALDERLNAASNPSPANTAPSSASPDEEQTET